jgi:hypothetical protein
MVVNPKIIMPKQKKAKGKDAFKRLLKKTLLIPGILRK